MQPSPDNQPEGSHGPGERALERTSGPRAAWQPREELSPERMEVRSLRPDDLQSVFEHYHLPFDERTTGRLIDALYLRRPLDPEDLQCGRDGVAIDCVLERRCQAGAGRYSESRSLELSAGYIADGGEGTLLPFLKFKLERSEPGRTGQAVDLTVEWNKSGMLPVNLGGFYTDPSERRWQPADEIAELLAGSAAPERMPPPHGGSCELDLAPNIKLTAGELLRHPLAALPAPPITGRPAWTPVGLTLHDPSAHVQSGILAALGVPDHAHLVSGGFFEAALAATQCGRIEPTDRLWELYSLPSQLEIVQRSTFVLGNEDFEPPTSEPQEEEQDEDEEPEHGEDEDEDDDWEYDLGGEASHIQYEWPIVTEITVRGLPTAHADCAIKFESVIFEESPDGETPDLFGPALTVELPWSRQQSASEIEARWALHARAAALLRNDPMTDELQKTPLEDADEAILQFGFDRYSVDVRVTGKQEKRVREGDEGKAP